MADDSAKPADRGELPKDVLAPAEGPRENLVATAVKFLQNQKVRQSPLSQKKAFLENKGLTSDEIQLAVQRAGVMDDTSSSLTGQLPQSPQPPAAYAHSALVPMQAMVPPPVPISPWTRTREIATTAAIVAAVSYAVYNLFKTYIRPWLTGRSESEARLARLEASITELQVAVTASSDHMAQTLKAIQESLTLQRDRAVQSTEVGQRQETHALSEIKSEVSSLKGLLLNRRSFPPPPSTSPVIPAWQRPAAWEETAAPSQSSDHDRRADDASTGSPHNAGPAAETQDEDKLQPLGDNTGPPAETSEDNVQVSQSASGDLSASQSLSSNNGFEVVKSLSESDPAIEED